MDDGGPVPPRVRGFRAIGRLGNYSSGNNWRSCCSTYNFRIVHYSPTIPFAEYSGASTHANYSDSDREMKRSIQSYLLAIMVAFAAVALLVAIAFANGVISPRLLGVVLLLLVGGLSIAVTLSLKKAAAGLDSGQRRTTTEASKIRGSIRRLQAAVVVLPVLLVTGLWSTRGSPLFPRMTGAGINISFTLWLISLIRRAKKQLP